MHSKTTMKAHLFKDRSSPAPQGEWIATNNKILRRAKRGVQREGVSGSHGGASVSGSDFRLRQEAPGTELCTVASLSLSNTHMIGAAEGGSCRRRALLWPEWAPHYLSGLL